MKNLMGKTTTNLAGAAALSLAFASSAQAQAEFNADFMINNPAGGADTRITVPIDCDLLGPYGQKTIEFVRQFDVFGHLDHETSIPRAEQHLSLHGIYPDKVDAVREYCIDNF